MNTKQNLKLTITSLGMLAATIVALAPNAPAGMSLATIPVLGTDTANEARAVSPDGVFAVGLSSPSGSGFLYNITNGYLVQPVSSDFIPAAAQIVTGVSYRTDSNQVPPQTELVLSGLSSGQFTAWMTIDGGTNWGPMFQYPAGPKKPTIPAANGLAGTSSDVFFAIWTDEGTASGDNWSLSIGQFSGSWVATPVWGPKAAAKPNLLQVNGISSNGRAVGWRTNSSLPTFNYIADWQGAATPAIWSNKGLDGTTSGQAFCVSADGTIIFGMSPRGTATGATNFGYKATFDSTFPGAPTQLSTGMLPNFSNTGGSINLAIPYGCTPDGKLVAGMNYRGVEKAVLWDTSDADTNKWTVTDLTDLAAANGILGQFTRLSRAYSVVLDPYGQKIVVGVGADTNSPANVRAFALSIPPTVSISTSPAKYTLSIQSITGRTYSLEYTTTLTPPHSWTPLNSKPGTGGLISFTDPNPADPRRFYHIKIQ